MNCPHCRAPNSDEARFCGSCGRATSATEPQSNPNLGEAPAVIGREIAGRYRILAKLGEGGMGAVYKAEQISLKRTVAVKLLRPEVASSPVLLRRFNAEATAVAKLSHPNTVNIYDFGQDADGTLFIAMEYIDGASLRSVIQRAAPLSLRRALAIAAQVATSLTDAHAHGLVHRDLKPDNVMLQDRAKDRDVARVLDFGIAKLRDDRQSQMAMTQAGDMLGTPQYMAPEQIRGEPIDGRTDVYALGCMLYEMVTGRMPYEAATVMALLSKHLLEVTVAPSQRRPDLQLPPAIDQLILGAMAKDPKVRPPTMEQFGDQIERLLATLPADSASHAAQPSSAYRTAEPVLTPMAPSAYAGPAAGVAAGVAAGAPAAPPPAAPAAYAAPSPYAGPPGAAAPTEPPFAPPAPPPMAAPYPPHAQTLTTRGANTGLWIVLVVIALAGAGIAAFFVLRDSSTAADGGRDPWAKGSGSGSQTVAATTGTTGTTGTTDPLPTPEARPTNVTDPWAAQPTTGSGGDPDDDADDDSPATGTFRRTVQGVRIRVPSGFRVTLATAQRFVASHPSGVEIGVFAITSTSNDVPTLAREYAALSGLTLIEVTPQPVGGHPGYVATYQGVFQGGPVTQAVTPLLGARHRVAVLIHVPDSTIQAAPQAVEAAGYVLVNGIQLP